MTGNSWSTRRLGDLCKFVGGSAFPRTEQGSKRGDYPFIKVSDLGLKENSRRINLANNWVSVSQINSMKAKLMPPGSVVFAKIGEGLKAERLSTLTRETAIDNNLMAAIPRESELDETYLYYLLSQIGLKDWAQGSALPYLRQSDLDEIPVFIPTLGEQRRIVGVLGSLDDLIEANLVLMRNLDEMGMALFHAAWDGDSWAPISSLGSLVMGQSPPGSTYNENGLGTVFFQGVRDFGDRYPRSRVHCTAPTRLAEKGDILIAVRAPIGETNVAVERTAIGRGLAALKSTRPATSLRALRSSLKTWAAHQGTGTVFSSISGPDLRNAEVPEVDDPALEANLMALDAMHLALSQENYVLSATRDELLPLLMSGRMCVAEGRAA